MKRKLTIFVFIVLWPFAATAQMDGEQLQNMLSQIKTMQANFNQTIRGESGRTQRSSGVMALQRPGKFRWDIQKPMPQLLVSNGSKLWIYDPDLEQVTIKPIQGEVGKTPALFISGADSSAIDAYQVKASGSSSRTKYTLIPKSSEASFVSIELSFTKQKLTRMRLVDRLGQTSDIKFSQIRVNEVVSANLFTFKPPPGVDVIG